MKLDVRPFAAIGALLAAALAIGATQDKPAGRSAVLNMRECMDVARNQWMAEITQELAKIQEADAGRATDLNPQERNRIRVKNMDHYNKRRLELYAAVVRISGAVAKERGFELIQRADPMPVAVSGDPDLIAQFYSRDVIYHDPALDITGEVLDRLNKEHAARKK